MIPTRAGPFLFAALLLAVPAAIDAQVSRDGREDYERLAEYLARDGGRWRAENPNHDEADPRSVRAYGLWFERTLENAVLEVSIVAHVGAAAYVTTKGTWIWHPGRSEIVYRTVGWDGTVSEGVTHFETPDVFVTVTEAAAADGTRHTYRDVNRMSAADRHENASYLMDVAGRWVEQGTFEWRRVATAG